ncbi:MAG: fumarylacetoacetate hydrolase family protein, partial [Pseudomonadota bacterium]
MTASQTADLFMLARKNASTVAWQDIVPASRADAFAIQDATIALFGVGGGWKVGSKGPGFEPGCAPLPAACLLESGVTLTGPAWRLRGVELEVALRVGRDLDPQGRLLPPEELAAAFDAVLPVIEVVESRLDDRQGSDPLAQLADLQNHGALVLGTPSAFLPADVDLRSIEACLSFDGEVVATTRGGNPAEDLWPMLAWLALHCEQRGQPLRKGQIVTTGSCTGMLVAPAGTLVQG